MTADFFFPLRAASLTSRTCHAYRVQGGERRAPAPAFPLSRSINRIASEAGVAVHPIYNSIDSAGQGPQFAATRAPLSGGWRRPF